MKKTKAFITMAILMVSVGAYGCSPYANRNHINPITGRNNNTNSFSRNTGNAGNDGYYLNNTINNRNNHINPITGRAYNDTNSFSGDNNGYLNNRNNHINPITGRANNNTNSFSGNNGSGYFSNNTINRRTTTNNGVINNNDGNRALNNRRNSITTTDGDHTFTSNIINRHSLNSNRVASIRKGMTYDEVLSSTGIAPYFRNQNDAALANNRRNGIAYYFVNGRSLKISFINGIVDRVYY